MANPAIEIITGKERRRRWRVAEKLRMVAESEEAGACVSAVAARHEVYPSLLFAWRRQAREGRLAEPAPAEFAPVRLIASPEAAVPPASRHPTPPVVPGPAAIEVVLADGSQVRISHDAPAALLRAVLTALRP